MQQLLKYILVLLFVTVGSIPLSAQELNAAVSVNSARVQSANRELFTSLETALRTFINDRKWSDTQFQPAQRIHCSFALVITEAASPNSFKAELTVQARRPVFNAAYTTALLNFRDTQLHFDFMEYQPLEFDINNIQSSLTAAVAFYAYLILGLDFDSMSPMGGTPYFQKMQTIAANVQSNGWSGWEASFGAQRSRFAVAAAFNDAAQDAYRQMWYEYHRLGLDEMAENMEKGREKVVTSPSVISSIHARRPTSVLVTLFGDAKLDELVQILAETPQKEKREAYETLRNIYPTRTAELEKIKNKK